MNCSKNLILRRSLPASWVISGTSMIKMEMDSLIKMSSSNLLRMCILMMIWMRHRELTMQSSKKCSKNLTKMATGSSPKMKCLISSHLCSELRQPRLIISDVKESCKIRRTLSRRKRRRRSKWLPPRMTVLSLLLTSFAQRTKKWRSLKSAWKNKVSNLTRF